MFKDNEVDILKTRNSQLFHAYLRNTVEHLANSISKDEFKKYIQTLKTKDSTANKLYEMQKSELIGDIQQDIDIMWKENNIDEKHKVITDLMNRSPKDVMAWRPITGDCEMQIASDKVRIARERRDKLKLLVQEQRTMKTILKNSVEKKRTLIIEQQKQILQAKEKLNEYKQFIVNSATEGNYTVID